MTDSGRQQAQGHDSSGFRYADLSNFPLLEQGTRNQETRDLRHSITPPQTGENSSVSSFESIRDRFTASSGAGFEPTSTPRAPSNSISMSKSTTPRPGSPIPGATSLGSRNILRPGNSFTSRFRRASGDKNTTPRGTGSTQSQDSELYRRRTERESSRDHTSGSMPRINTMAGRPSRSERPDKSPNTTVSSSVRSSTQSLIGHSDSNVRSHAGTSDWSSVRSSSPETPKIASNKLKPNRAPERSSPATTEQKWIGDGAVWRPGTSQEIPTRNHNGTLQGLDYKSPGKTYLQEWQENYMNKKATPTSLVKNIIEYHDEQIRSLQNITFSVMSKKSPADPSDVGQAEAQKTTDLNREISKIKSAIAIAHNDNLNYQTTIHELRNELEGARAVTKKREAELKEEKRMVQRFSKQLEKRQAEDDRESESRRALAFARSTDGLMPKKVSTVVEAPRVAVTEVSTVVETPRVAVTAMKTPKSAKFGGGVRHVETYHQNNINTVGMNLCLMEMEDFYSADSYRLATVAAESALRYAKRQHNDKILAETYAWTGACYHRSNDVKSAMSSFEMALETAKGLKQDEGLLDWMVTISAWLQDLKNFERRWT